MLSAECSFSNSRFSCFPSNTLSHFNISLSVLPLEYKGEFRMAERLHRSSGVPNFTNPSDPERLLPEHNRTALEERASQVGSVVGKVVVMLRRTQNTLKDVPNIPSNAANRINNLADAARMKAQDAANRISDLADKIGRAHV